MPAEAKMPDATLALTPVLQLTRMFFTSFNSPTLLYSSGSGIRMEFSITPPDAYSGLFLTSRCLTSLSSLNWSKFTILGFQDGPFQSDMVKSLYPRMLKYPILKNRSAISLHSPGEVIITNYSSGDKMLASQLVIDPRAKNQYTFSPWIIDSGLFLVSIIGTFPNKPPNYSADRGRLAFSRKD